LKKLTTAICAGLLGALAVAPVAQAGFGGPTYAFQCQESGDTHITDYFCDGLYLYEVKVNCTSLTDGIGGGLWVYPASINYGSGNWNFQVSQGTVDYPYDPVCRANGIYGDQAKTELKCTDALGGSNKPDKNHPDGYDQADFTIKALGYNPEVCD
jgi:hypothetical protein